MLASIFYNDIWRRHAIFVRRWLVRSKKISDTQRTNLEFVSFFFYFIISFNYINIVISTEQSPYRVTYVMNCSGFYFLNRIAILINQCDTKKICKTQPKHRRIVTKFLILDKLVKPQVHIIPFTKIKGAVVTITFWSHVSIQKNSPDCTFCSTKRLEI